MARFAFFPGASIFSQFSHARAKSSCLCTKTGRRNIVKNLEFLTAGVPKHPQNTACVTPESRPARAPDAARTRLTPVLLHRHGENANFRPKTRETEPFWTIRPPPGRSSEAPGFSLDASRTLHGRLPDSSSDASRTAPNHAVVFSNSVAFSNSV